MKTNQLTLALAALTSAFLFSCKKEKDIPGITYQLKTSTTSSNISARVMGGSVQWTSGFANVAELEFEAQSNSVEIEYNSEARQKIDLFSSISSLGVVSVPPGTYEEIEFEVEVQPSGSEAALQLGGTYTNSSGQIIPLVLKVNTAIEIESEKENITITDISSYSALTTLNLSLITTGVTETMFNSAVRTGGVIEISATSNADIYNIMLQNLKACGGVEVED